MEDSDKLELAGDPKWFSEWAYPDQPFNRGACVASMWLESRMHDVAQEMTCAALYHAYNLRG
jgi:hypothetical protein